MDHHTSAIRAIVATEAGFVQPGAGGSRRGGGDGGEGKDGDRPEIGIAEARVVSPNVSIQLVKASVVQATVV